MFLNSTTLPHIPSEVRSIPDTQSFGSSRKQFSDKLILRAVLQRCHLPHPHPSPKGGRPEGLRHFQGGRWVGGCSPPRPEAFIHLRAKSNRHRVSHDSTDGSTRHPVRPPRGTWSLRGTGMRRMDHRFEGVCVIVWKGYMIWKG